MMTAYDFIRESLSRLPSDPAEHDEWCREVAEALDRRAGWAITEGVRQAFADALSTISLSHAIQTGAEKALDQLWPSQIVSAIEEGTRKALKR